jgi:uncharacterized membrane protein
MGYDSQGRWKKTRRQDRPKPLREPTAVNTKPQEGQHLIVPVGLACDLCGRPTDCHAVKRGDKLVCVACDAPADAPKPKRRKKGG